MVKLIVKIAVRNKENPSEVFEVGQEIEVSEERAKDALKNYPEHVEEVKAKPAPKKTTRKSKASKNEDDE